MQAVQAVLPHPGLHGHLEEPLISPCQPVAAAKSQHATKSSGGSLSSWLTPRDIQGTLAFLFLGKTKMSALVTLAELE